VQLNLDQAIDSDFVFEQTRGEETYIASEHLLSTPVSDEDQRAGKGVLISTVLAESRLEHLTSGFMGSVRDREATSVLARLNRELAAMGFSADTSYQTLINKRAIMLARLFKAYDSDYRKHRMTSSLKKQYGNSNLHLLLQIGISSGVHIMLSLLQHSAYKDPSLAHSILTYLQGQLAAVPSMFFSETKEGLSSEKLSLDTFDAIHNTLLACAIDDKISKGLKEKCFELLMSISVSTGSLAHILTVIKLLLMRFDAKKIDDEEPVREDDTRPECIHGIECRAYRSKPRHEKHCATYKHTTGRQINDKVNIFSLLKKLENIQRDLSIDLPSKERLGTVQNTAALEESGRLLSICTDGSYIYIHSKKGLFKVGSGEGNNSWNYLCSNLTLEIK